MKAILFSRVSTLGQDLTQQNDELYAEAERNGYCKSDLILIEHKESAIKLDEDERLGIQEMKDTILKEKVECVIVYEISRLSRRPTVLYSVRDFLIEHHVNLICMKPYMRLLDPDGKMSQTASILFSLFGALSESEMMIKKERMIRGRLAKRNQLKYIGGNLLFGYTYDKETDKIFINENERATVVEIFERYVKNESVRSIAKDLIDRGMLRYDDYATACVMLHRMLKRSEYAGICANSYPYPQIISQELYYNVRKRAASKNKYKTRVSEIYYLQQLIYWKKYNMMMSPSKLTILYRAWREATNTGIHINMDYTDSLVWYFVIMYKNKYSGTEKAKTVKSLLEEMMHNNQRLNNTIIEHNSIIKTIERINERIVKGKMSDVQGDKLIEEHQTRLKELDNLTIKYSEDNQHIKKQLDDLQHNIEDYNTLTVEQKNKIIRDCVKRVDVEKDGIKSTGRYIDIYMMDNTVHHIHMTKRGNYFNTFIIKNGKETKINIPIITRFIRKKTIRKKKQ